MSQLPSSDPPSDRSGSDKENPRSQKESHESSPTKRQRLTRLGRSDHTRSSSNASAAPINPYYRAEVCKEFEEWLANCRATDYRRSLTFSSFTEAHSLICDLREAYQIPAKQARMYQVLQNKSKQDVQTANELSRFMFVEMSSELKLKSSTAVELAVNPYNNENESTYAPELEWADDVLQASYAIKDDDLPRLQTEGVQVYRVWQQFASTSSSSGSSSRG